MNECGTVLVVDDNPFIRETAREMFEDLGCKVLDAYNAADALALAAAHPEITLAFVDVKMPGRMDGLGLAALLHDMRPGIRIALTSGYGMAGPERFQFLPKPRTTAQLAALLDSAKEGA